MFRIQRADPEAQWGSVKAGKRKHVVKIMCILSAYERAAHPDQKYSNSLAYALNAAAELLEHWETTHEGADPRKARP